MSIRYLVLLGLCLSGVPSTVSAQPPADPFTAGTTRLVGFIEQNIIKSAEKMAEEQYAFRPTPDVRSFGAILGHIANSNYSFCSQAASEENPSKVDVEQTVTSKPKLVAALRGSFEYCGRVLASMNDRKGSELVKVLGGDFARLSVLTLNTAHNFEHYGNLITYLRLKGLVPPSSEPSK